MDGSVVDQYVWNPAYIDAMVLRDSKAFGRHYALQDADWNTVAVADEGGGIKERFAYEPFGTVQYLSSDWSPQPVSGLGWVYLFQGGRLDAAVGLTQFRYRDLMMALGRWMSQDPKGFDAGDTNHYRLSWNTPISHVDPLGLDVLVIWSEGATYKGRLNALIPDNLEITIIKDLKDTFKKGVEFKRFSTGWGFLKDTQANEIASKVFDCNKEDDIIVIGYSWGGDQAIRGIEYAVTKKRHPNNKPIQDAERHQIAHVFTIDPVLNRTRDQHGIIPQLNPLPYTNHPLYAPYTALYGSAFAATAANAFPMIGNYLKWDNWYQQSDTGSVLGMPIHGTPLIGAKITNHLVDKFPFMPKELIGKEHVGILLDPSIKVTIKKSIQDLLDKQAKKK